MSAFQKCSIPRQSSYNSLYLNPLTELKHYRSCSEGTLSDEKENFTPNKAKIPIHGKENEEPNNGFCAAAKPIPTGKAYLRDRALKPSSLQLCMQMNEPDLAFRGSKIWDPIESDSKSSGNVWDYSDSEAAPASSWSTLPNRSLLCRPLPVDIGRCTCVIVKEASPEGLDGGTIYSLYTNEGKGRQDRKIAVAHHRRHSGRSEFVVAQNMKGICCSSDDSFIGIVTANLMGSKYHIWDQGSQLNSQSKQSKSPLAVVSFMPTLATWTGSYRSMKVWAPKHQSMQLKSTTAQIQHTARLPKDWEAKMDKVHQLFSRTPHYNNTSKQYELDFRDRTRSGLKIQSSVKNFQLILEKNGRQTILQLGRVGKAKYVMDYRYPLTGFHAFCICLASIDSKLCCTL
ncbi:Tubby-like protein [Actinidia chinensis var. chinensis]|uniref:Tubby-like protein n=1 Tax=Actinidia chinensis var. chinensis TaxID=1590841 RepID=A0A2R6PSD2_ACTCC|nr:Tubby-like protein [Actinidia chinensis var. chinensis]